MVTIPVRVKPGSTRPRVGGRYDGRNGPALVVAVSARAVDGRATEAVLHAIAEALGVRDREVRLRAGGGSRDKLIEVAGPPAELEARVRALRDGAP